MKDDSKKTSTRILIICIFLCFFSCTGNYSNIDDYNPVDSISMEAMPTQYNLLKYEGVPNKLALFSIKPNSIYLLDEQQNKFVIQDSTLPTSINPELADQMRFLILYLDNKKLVTALNDTIFYYSLSNNHVKKFQLPRPPLEFYNGFNSPVLIDSITYFTSIKVKSLNESPPQVDEKTPVMKKVIIGNDKVSLESIPVYMEHSNEDKNYLRYHVFAVGDSSNSFYYNFAYNDTVNYWENGKVSRQYIIEPAYSVMVKPLDNSKEMNNRLIMDPRIEELFVGNDELLIKVKLKSDSVNSEGMYITYEDVPKVYLLYDKFKEKYEKALKIRNGHSIIFNLGNRYYARDLKSSTSKWLYVYEF